MSESSACRVWNMENQLLADYHCRYYFQIECKCRKKTWIIVKPWAYIWMINKINNEFADWIIATPLPLSPVSGAHFKTVALYNIIVFFFTPTPTDFSYATCSDWACTSSSEAKCIYGACAGTLTRQRCWVRLRTHVIALNTIQHDTTPSWEARITRQCFAQLFHPTNHGENLCPLTRWPDLATDQSAENSHPSQLRCVKVRSQGRATCLPEKLAVNKSVERVLRDTVNWPSCNNCGRSVATGRESY